MAFMESTDLGPAVPEGVSLAKSASIKPTTQGALIGKHGGAVGREEWYVSASLSLSLTHTHTHKHTHTIFENVKSKGKMSLCTIWLVL